MRRKRLILSVALGLLAIGVTLVLLRGPKEPVFEGQKLGYWIRKALHSTDVRTEEQAERAVKAAGTNALPYLLDQLTRRSSSWPRTLNRAFERFHPSFHAETEDERISVAIFGLSALGPDAAPALPALTKELHDPRRGITAAVIMCQCGDKALPFFREAIKSTNAVVGLPLLVSGASASLEREAEAGPLIEKLLTDPDSDIRRKTVVAWSLSGRYKGVQQLNRALHDTEPEVQIAAAEALGKVANDGQLRFATPELLRLVTNSNERLARAASNAVQRINVSAMPRADPSNP